MKKIYDREHIIEQGEDYVISSSTEKGKPNRNKDHTFYAIHPQFPNVKMLILADGITDAKDGAAGAQLFCDQIEKIFNKLDEDAFCNVEYTMQQMLYAVDSFISGFNKQCAAQCYALGSFMIIVDDTLYSLTVGDIRAYYKKDGKVVKINNFGTEYEIGKAIGASDEIIEKYNPKAKTTPARTIGRSLVAKKEYVTVVEGIEGAYLMCAGVGDYISEDCKSLVIENIDPAEVSRSLVEIAQYGKTMVDGVIYEEETISSRCDKNLSAISYAKVKGKSLER